MNKPEPIRVGVEGIAPKPIELTPQRPRIEWERLFALPPFQMFAVERARRSSDDVMDWMPAWVQAQPELALFDDYCQWHTAKGYWPHEDPTGRLIEGDG